ncbi:MAG TPA: N-acetylmuramoyl-L-alanine amidase [Spirochaetia bacterium]|nr:N-acetylmuramoyl-L-alanine amidase [Spirochaetia bacterium]
MDERSIARKVPHLCRKLLMLIIWVSSILFPFTVFSDDISLISLAEEMHAHLRWEPYRGIGMVEKLNVTVVFRPLEPWIIVNYERKLPVEGLTVDEGGVVKLSQKDAALFRELLKDPEVKPGKLSIAAIIIDPGHGGKDPGTNHNHEQKGGVLHVVEKDLVLDIAKDLHKLLTKAYPSKKVVMTRYDDTYVSLEERTEMANTFKPAQNEATIFISIHANASLNQNAKGYEVWYLPADFKRDLIDPSSFDKGNKDLIPIFNTMLEQEYMTASIVLARSIIGGLDGSIGASSVNRGLKEEPWFVVRNARMPSVLVEVGFVSNKEEAALLSDPAYLKKISEGIYNGVSRFITTFESTGVLSE